MAVAARATVSAEVLEAPIVEGPATRTHLAIKIVRRLVIVR